jgi:II/X family phage/plasmid replication protein
MLQECYKNVTRMLQHCYKNVTTMLRECYENVTRMLQQCYKNVTRMLQQCYKNVTTMLQECYNNVTRMLPHIRLWKNFKNSLKKFTVQISKRQLVAHEYYSSVATCWTNFERSLDFLAVFQNVPVFIPQLAEPLTMFCNTMVCKC